MLLSSKIGKCEVCCLPEREFYLIMKNIPESRAILFCYWTHLIQVQQIPGIDLQLVIRQRRTKV